MTRYQNVTVQLTGNDGDAFAIIGQVRRALRQAGVQQAEIEQYTQEATSGDYINLLQVTMKWVTVLVVVLAAVLFALPAQAQDTTHTVYMPLLGDSFRTWFTEAELNAERQQAGYDPAVVSVHTSCVLHPASTPESVRYYRCSQYYVNGQPTTNAVVLYWFWRGEMWHLTMSSIGSGE